MTREEKEAIKGKTIHDAMCSIENRVRHVYNQGFEEGKNYYIQKHGDAYNKGLEDAWECARKITNDMTSEDLESCNLFANVRNDEDYEYSCKVIKMYSASQAISKIKEYEENQRQEWKDGFENKQLEQLCNHLEQQKKIEKSCDNCGFSYGQYKEYCNISGCCDYRKWTQKHICHTCRYGGDNYDKFNIELYEKRLRCRCCDNFDNYISIYNDVIDKEIKVGDQLEIIESSAEHRKCVVLKIDDCATVVYDDGEVGYINPECYRKTGKHFPELAEFLEKMKGE